MSMHFQETRDQVWEPSGPRSAREGATQRAWLQARINAIRGWTLIASLVGGVLATDLAIHHTNATSAAAAASSAPIALAQQGQTGSSLFQGQGNIASSGTGALLAPTTAPAGRAVARSSTS